MCPTPKPVYDFGQRAIGHFVNQQLDLVDKEIERLEKKGYMIYYSAILREEYETSQFIKLAKKYMKYAKDISKGRHYYGINLFLPFIKKKNSKKLFNPNRSSLIFKVCRKLFELSTQFNEDICLNSAFINPTNRNCKDQNIYWMLFYFKRRQIENEKVYQKKG